MHMALASRIAATILIAAGLLSTASCQSNTVKASTPTLHVVSSAFNEGGTIPADFTCDGVNVSPPLRWSNPPASTASIAVVADDPDASSGDFTHWIVYNLPPTARQLPKNVSPVPVLASGAKQGQNDFEKIGYSGPCPPEGAPHHYHFHVYALDKRLGFTDTIRRGDIDSAIEGHIVAEGELVATYGR
jgi:hypothetical protein